MGIKDIQQNTFKSVALERKTQKADSIESFINNAEGETSTQAQMPKNKGGAPLKPEEHKASARINIYCTQSEKRLLKAMAQDYNMKIGEFVRFKLFKEQKMKE